MKKKEKLSLKGLMASLESIEDPRRKWGNLRHNFIDILVIALLAILCGAQSWEEMEDYGKTKQAWLREFLALDNGIPCADTFRRLLEKLDPAGLEKAYRQWIMPYVGGCLNKQIGIDGKTIRGASNARENEMTLHMVSAWVREDGVSLGQIRTEEKSNEITAIPQLLDTVDIAGAVVSIDAMGCQKEIARKITEKDANYLLALKLNQPTLYREVEEYFDWAVQDNIERDTLSRYESTEKEHGRISIRTVTATTDVNWFESKHEWAYLRTFIMVERRTLLGDEETYEKQYYVSSLVATAKRFSELVRGHWSIENQLHWMLDVTFGEDASRIHKDHSAENLSLIRKIALTLLKKDTSRKASVARKQNIAGWDNDFLASLF